MIMEEIEKLRLFWTRFVHNGALFAEQTYKEGLGTTYFPKRNGVCRHDPPHRPKSNCPDISDIVFSKEHLIEHLKGRKTYAPYQVSKKDTVKWLCLDVDIEKAKDEEERATQEDAQKTLTKLCKVVYNKLGENSFLVEDSGGRGYHVWVFFDEPILAGHARSLGTVLADETTKTAGVNIEVYPKQNSLRLLGNTVKLPLGVHRQTGNRCLFLTNRGGKLVPHEDQWQALANVRTIESEQIIKDYPIKVQEPEEAESSQRLWAPSCLVQIMEDGVRPGFRDEPAFKLACYFRAKGIPEDLALKFMEEWNTKNIPPIPDDVIITKVQSAYTGGYSWRPCGSTQFDHVCHSSCPFFEQKVKFRWRDTEKSPIGVISID